MGTANDALRQPLLPPDSKSHSYSHSAPKDVPAHQHASSWRGLLGAARPWQGAALFAISIVEALAISHVGTVSADFYAVFVDGRRDALLQVAGRACALYAVAALASSCKAFLQDYLALLWRRRLTVRLHARYCAGAAFYTLLQRPTPPHSAMAPSHNPTAAATVESSRGAAKYVHPDETHTISVGAKSRVPQAVDNPDQRIAQDLPQLCAAAARVAGTLSSVPFSLCLYAYLTYQASFAEPHSRVGSASACARLAEYKPCSDE